MDKNAQTTSSATSGERAADALAARIEQQILNGVLKNAKPLPAERDLMTQFGVSRTVVREAISLLAARGLLTTRMRHRPVVHKPDYSTLLSATDAIVRHMLAEPDGIRSLYESRKFVERGLVREAAVHATMEDIAALKDALGANREAISNSLQFYETDMAFHAVLYRVMRNPIFPVVNDGFRAWLAPHWQKMQSSHARNALNFQAHKAIYEAIVERDPDRAEAAMARHLDQAWNLVKDTFDLPDAGNR